MARDNNLRARTRASKARDFSVVTAAVSASALSRGENFAQISALQPGGPGPAPRENRKRLIDTTSAQRKEYPLARGLLDYFPDALAEVARVSYLGNQTHNPGEDMHHARGKSMDHADCAMRHLTERGGFDGDIRHSAALAWRALALLQEELETELGLPLPRAARA